MNGEYGALLLLCANLINAEIKIDIARDGDGWYVLDGEGLGRFSALQSRSSDGIEDSLVELSLGNAEGKPCSPHDAFIAIAARCCVPVKREGEFFELSESVRHELTELIRTTSDTAPMPSDGIPIISNRPIESNGEEGIPKGGFDCTEDLEFVIDYLGISYEEISDENGEPSFSKFYSLIEKKRGEVEARLDGGVSGLQSDEMSDILRFMAYADGFAEMLGGMIDGMDEPENGSEEL